MAGTSRVDADCRLSIVDHSLFLFVVFLYVSVCLPPSLTSRSEDSPDPDTGYLDCVYYTVEVHIPSSRDSALSKVALRTVLEYRAVK